MSISVGDSAIGRFSFDELKAKYEKPPLLGRVVSIQPHNKLDHYNPSNAFKHDNFWYHCVREEIRGNDFDYRTQFYKEITPYLWQLDTSIPMLPLQDPFVTKIYDQIVVGGVEYRPGELYTTFYKGSSIDKLEVFAHGPMNQKDIRLCETRDGKVAILTRPGRFTGVKGKIGFTIIPSLDYLNEDAILGAPLLLEQPDDDEWWGSNDAELLPNGDIGVIGHIAKRDISGLNYAPIAFIISPDGEMTNLKMLATRSDFPITDAKQNNLTEVIFSAGIKRRDGRILLYAGLSDTSIGVIGISDPFK